MRIASLTRLSPTALVPDEPHGLRPKNAFDRHKPRAFRRSHTGKHYALRNPMV
jgi:hypothetical protein